MSARISAAGISPAAYFKLAFSPSAAAPLPFDALLLFNEPSGLTLRTLFAFHGLGERIHHEAE